MAGQVKSGAQVTGRSARPKRRVAPKQDYSCNPIATRSSLVIVSAQDVGQLGRRSCTACDALARSACTTPTKPMRLVWRERRTHHQCASSPNLGRGRATGVGRTACDKQYVSSMLTTPKAPCLLRSQPPTHLLCECVGALQVCEQALQLQAVALSWIRRAAGHARRCRRCWARRPRALVHHLHLV